MPRESVLAPVFATLIFVVVMIAIGILFSQFSHFVQLSYEVILASLVILVVYLIFSGRISEFRSIDLLEDWPEKHRKRVMDYLKVKRSKASNDNMNRKEE
jgi:amino acid transporter